MDYDTQIIPAFIIRHNDPKFLPIAVAAPVNSATTELSQELWQPGILVKKLYFGHLRIMDQPSAIKAFAALAQPTRLAVFRLLVKVGPDGMPALDIARQLGIVPSTLSGHFSVLKKSGILKATRHQREIHYAADLSVVNDLIRFLLADCCGGQIENCADILSLLKTR